MRWKVFIQHKKQWSTYITMQQTLWDILSVIPIFNTFISNEMLALSSTLSFHPISTQKVNQYQHNCTNFTTIAGIGTTLQPNYTTTTVLSIWNIDSYSIIMQEESAADPALPMSSGQLDDLTLTLGFCYTPLLSQREKNLFLNPCHISVLSFSSCSGASTHSPAPFLHFFLSLVSMTMPQPVSIPFSCLQFFTALFFLFSPTLWPV